MKHPAFLLSAIACTSLLAGAPASAQQPRDALLDAVRQFERADHDGNKSLSWEEFRSHVLHIFHEADHDGNGVIQGDEHPPAFDASGKTVEPRDVTIEAFNAEVRRVFQLADTDKSGELSYAEYAGKA
jgi:Ca2+-binding EF-hand superfamily protein